jgi:hypothetical protein
VHRKGGVVRLDDGVGDLNGRSAVHPGTINGWQPFQAKAVARRTHLGGGDDGESAHHAVRELLTDLGDQEGTHTGTGTTTERVGDLETLEAVTALGFAADDVEDGVDELGT